MKMKCKFDFIEKFDMFGKSIGLYYDGHQKKNSLLGIIFTLVYITIFLILFIYKFIKVIKKTEIIIYDKSAFTDNPPFIKLNNDLFYISFALEDPLTYDSFVNESIYYPKAYYKKAVRNGNEWEWFIKELEIEICKIEKFGKAYQEIYKKKPLNNLYCLKEINESLIGHYSYDNYSLFYISFFPCKNSTENNNHCKPREDIDYYLNGTFVSFYMQDIEMNLQEYDIPVIPRNTDIYTTVGKRIFKEIHAFLQIVKIKTDLDIFGIDNFQHIKRNEFLKYESISVMSNIIENDIYSTGQSFCDVTLKLSDKILIEERTFTKLIEILGNIGGFMEVTFSLLKIISSFPIHILYETSLVNNLFEFNIDKKLIIFNSKDRRTIKENITLHPKLYIPVRSYRKAFKKNNSNIEGKMNTTDSPLNLGERRCQSFLYTNSKIKNNEFKLKPQFSLNYKAFENNLNIIKFKLNYENNDIRKNNYKSDPKIFKTKMNFNKDSSNNKEFGKREDTIIKRMKINSLCIYFCFFYVRKRKNVQNILLDEGVRLIVEQLDLVNIFKKLYNQDNVKDINIIKMSNDCKYKLNKICNIISF